MISKALLQAFGADEPCYHEEQLVASELKIRGTPFESFHSKQLLHRKLELDHETLVVGDFETTTSALKQLGVRPPKPNDYPKSLRHHLHRRIRKSTLGKVEQQLLNGFSEPFFLKPAGRAKCFIGGLVEHPDDIYYHAAGVSAREPVWVVEPVEWLSEWRCYVIDQEIRSIDFYSGDPERPIASEIVKQAVEELAQGEEALASFTLDFGVLSSGETALVEMNEGYSIGAYQIDSSSYADFLIARWEELLKTAQPK